MLKLMNALLILVILCEGIQSINGEALQCKFRDVNYFRALGSLYSCSVTGLQNPNDNKIITGYSGVHMANKYDNDVKLIHIYDLNTKYIPANIGSLFNLNVLIIHGSKLVEIRSKDFQGMQNLEYLSLGSNKLTSLPSDAFSMLPNLKYIDLSYNQIQYIGSGAFAQLTNLNEVYLMENICVNKYYDGATAITQMKEDIKVNCVEPLSTSTTTTTTTTTTQDPMEFELKALKNEAKEQQRMNEIELIKLRDDLKKEQMENSRIRLEKDTLMNDKESLKMELNNITSEINELKKEKDIKLNQFIGMKQNQEDLKKMMEQILNASQEHQMECNELIKLRAELSAAKEEQKMTMDQQKKEQEVNTKVTNERDELKKELTEAKETIDLKLPKMEQTIEDFYMEVMDLKIERHNERQNSIGLRSKLMEANEQLAECQINERISC